MLVLFLASDAAAQINGGFATQEDGDVLYAVTTDEVETPSLSSIDLGVVASELAWDAVLSTVPELPAAPVRLEDQPDEKMLQSFSNKILLNGKIILIPPSKCNILTAR